MPHKENRKLIKLGNISLAVTLPKTWLDYYNLKAGETVELISNGEITIKRIEKGQLTPSAKKGS